MGSITPALFDGLLQKFYTPRKLESMLFDEFPLLMAVEKLSNAGGSSFEQPVMNGANTKRSADYATAYAGTAPAVAARFSLPYVQDYAISEIDGKVFAESNVNLGSYMKVFQQQTDASMRALRKSYAMKLYRTGTGSVAQLASTANTASSIIALANPADTYCFEIGDVIQASQTDGGLVRGGTSTIVDIDPSAGTLTFNAVYNSTLTLSTTSDYLYLNGDQQNASTTPTVIPGLLAWAPATTLSLTVSFNGVVRSTDRRRLAGLYYPNTLAYPVDEQIQNAITGLVANGGKPNAVFMNPVDHLALVKVAGNKVMRQQGGTAKIGFQAVDFISSNGTIPCYPDPACPAGKAFVVDTTGLVLVSMGNIAEAMKQGDASAVTRKAGSDSYYVQFGGYPTFAVERPGQCIATADL
jgi:putative hemolysin